MIYLKQNAFKRIFSQKLLKNAQFLKFLINKKFRKKLRFLYEKCVVNLLKLMVCCIFASLFNDLERQKISMSSFFNYKRLKILFMYMLRIHIKHDNGKEESV